MQISSFGECPTDPEQFQIQLNQSPAPAVADQAQIQIHGQTRQAQLSLGHSPRPNKSGNQAPFLVYLK